MIVGDLWLRILLWIPFRESITFASAPEFFSRYSPFRGETRPAVQICWNECVQDSVVRRLFSQYLQPHRIKPASAIVLARCQLLGDVPPNTFSCQHRLDTGLAQS